MGKLGPEGWLHVRPLDIASTPTGKITAALPSLGKEKLVPVDLFDYYRELAGDVEVPVGSEQEMNGITALIPEEKRLNSTKEGIENEATCLPLEETSFVAGSGMDVSWLVENCNDSTTAGNHEVEIRVEKKDVRRLKKTRIPVRSSSRLKRKREEEEQEREAILKMSDSDLTQKSSFTADLVKNSLECGKKSGDEDITEGDSLTPRIQSVIKVRAFLPRIKPPIIKVKSLLPRVQPITQIKSLLPKIRPITQVKTLLPKIRPLIKVNTRLPRIQPPNMIDRKHLTAKEFRLGLINAKKELVAGRYLEHSSFTYPPTKTMFKPSDGRSIYVEQPLDKERVKDMQTLEWFEKVNSQAFCKTHGPRKPGGKKPNAKPNPDGNVIQKKGAIPFQTTNFDFNYNSLLEHQNSLKAVRHFKAACEVEKDLMNSEKEDELDVTFQNLNCFNELLEDEYRKRNKSTLPFGTVGSVIGAVQVDVPKFDRSKVFLGHRAIFSHCGKNYRINPAVVMIEKISDELIESVMAEPQQQVNTDSIFYKSMTTLLEKHYSCTLNSDSPEEN